jgi:5-methylcytosine-specific restriction endonuclease McrA
LTLDEVVPRCKGGKRSFENCQTLCSKCNGEKGSKTIDYRKNETDKKREE